MRLRPDMSSRLARGMLTVLLGFVWCHCPLLAAEPPSVPAVGPASRPAFNPKELADELERFLQVVAKTELGLPRETFDPAVIVAAVGKDPEKLLGWVRDETVLVPYQGALRGERGVLMDRVGNSLDRALLLDKLLRLAGHETRLARGTLTKQQAAELLAKLPTPKPRALPAAEVNDAQLVANCAETLKLDAEVLKRRMEADAKRERALAEQFQSRSTPQAAELLKAVEASRRADGKQDDATAGALMDHWWVQRQAGEAWVDLDPSSADGQPAGKALVAAQDVVKNRAADGRPAIDASLWHTVDVHIVIEQWDGKKLKDTEVLRYAIRPADAIDARISLHHMPFNQDDSADAYSDTKVRETALSHRHWLPVLRIDRQVVSNLAFDDRGHTLKPSAPLGDSGQEAGNAAGGILKGGGIGRNVPGRAGTRSESVVAAEWIEYEIHPPGVKPTKVRHPVFDLIGPAARASGKPEIGQVDDARRLQRATALMGEIEVLALPCNLSPEFVADLTMRRLVENGPALLATLRAKNEVAAKEAMNDLVPLPGALHSVALLRQVGQPTGIYLDRPNVLAHYLRPLADEKGKWGYERTIDVAYGEVGARGTDAFANRLTQGVRDTNAEALVLSPRKRDVINTANAYAAGGAADRAAWLTISSADDARWRSARVSADVRAAVDTDLKRGCAVVVPSAAMAMGERDAVTWWRIDRTSGATIGVGDNGLNVATEKSLMEGDIRTMTKMELIAYISANCQTAGRVALFVLVQTGGAGGGFSWGTLGLGALIATLLIKGYEALTSGPPAEAPRVGGPPAIGQDGWPE